MNLPHSSHLTPEYLHLFSMFVWMWPLELGQLPPRKSEILRYGTGICSFVSQHRGGRYTKGIKEVNLNIAQWRKKYIFWILNFEFWILNFQSWILNPEFWILNANLESWIFYIVAPLWPIIYFHKVSLSHVNSKLNCKENVIFSFLEDIFPISSQVLTCCTINGLMGGSPIFVTSSWLCCLYKLDLANPLTLETVPSSITN